MERRIVVGTDGSEHANHALAWAAAEAQRWGAELVIVHGWLTMSVMTDPTGSSYGPAEEAGREILDEAIRQCQALAPQVTVTGRLVGASGERAVLQEATADDLVVVGARGHGAVGSLLIGSITDRVLHHARGAVVVVR